MERWWSSRYVVIIVIVAIVALFNVLVILLYNFDDYLMMSKMFTQPAVENSLQGAASNPDGHILMVGEVKEK